MTATAPQVPFVVVDDPHGFVVGNDRYKRFSFGVPGMDNFGLPMPLHETKKLPRVLAPQPSNRHARRKAEAKARRA